MKTKQDKIKVGEFYEDCAYHPVLCTKINGDNVEGISLVDGSFPRCCSIRNCGPKSISFKTAVRLKKYGPSKSKKEHIDELEKEGEWKFDKWWIIVK